MSTVSRKSSLLLREIVAYPRPQKGGALLSVLITVCSNSLSVGRPKHGQSKTPSSKISLSLACLSRFLLPRSEPTQAILCIYDECNSLPCCVQNFPSPVSHCSLLLLRKLTGSQVLNPWRPTAITWFIPCQKWQITVGSLLVWVEV